MPCTLRYGNGSTLDLPLEREQLAGCFLAEPAMPCDVHQATLHALQSPLDFPQLRQAIVSGDHVAVVVDRLVPHGATVAAAVLEHLGESVFAPDSVTIVFSEARDAADASVIRRRQTVPPGSAFAAKIEVEVHDPGDRGKLCYLTNTPSGRAIYLNRVVGEADFIIQIGSLRGAVSWAYRGPYGGIYPTYSDLETQRRFRNPALLHSGGETFLKSQEEVDSVGWRSGAQFSVQVVPGAGDDVAAVVAGEMSAVARRGETLRAAAHRHLVPQRVKTVIAALTGQTAQTWEQLARTLGAMLDVVQDGGVVALCTDLEEPLGPAMDLLSKCDDDRDAVLAHIRKERPTDLFAALELAEAQRRVRVHLLSKLDTDIVENLGMTPISDPADIGRLAARGGACVVVGDAQHAVLVGPDTAE